MRLRLSLKLVATFFFYLLIALMVIGSSFISDPVVSVFTYPTIIMVSLLFIMLLKLRVRLDGFVVGTAAALVSMGLVLGVLVLSGAVVIGPLADNYLGILFMGVILQLLVGFGEELSFRASIFQGLRDELGIAPAALLSAAAFAALHIPSMDFLGISATSDFIALGTIFFAGIALALLYAYGGLLNAIAFHFVWNFIEYNLFNLGPLEGAISVLKPGPVILTGGAFGPEASVVTLAVTALLALALWLYYTRRAKNAGRSPQV
jgi:membrane protease YdiL (CAAX protease family)